MKKIVMFMVCLMLFAGSAMAKSKVYGTGVQITEITKVSEILDNPGKFIGKRVAVSGMVIEVCAKRGCWIYVASDRPFEKIQVKVTDGEIVFPMSASGHDAIVEGVVEELKMTPEQILSYKRHLAEEKGVPFDPSTVNTDERFIRLIGKGAEIEE